MLSDNAKLFRTLLINFSAVIRTKLWSLNFLGVNFYRNNLEKNIYELEETLDSSTLKLFIKVLLAEIFETVK